MKNKNEFLTEYFSGLSDIALRKVISILEMITTLIEIQYEKNYIQDNVVIGAENYKRISTNKHEIASILDKLAKNLNVKLSAQKYTLIKDIFNSSSQSPDLEELEVPLNIEVLKVLKSSLQKAEKVLNKKSFNDRDGKIYIKIRDYLIYRGPIEEKMSYEPETKDRKLLLDFLLSNNRRIMRDELARYALKNSWIKEKEKGAKISDNIKDINRKFQNNLRFPKMTKYRLILPSNKKGYSINYETFRIVRTFEDK